MSMKMGVNMITVVANVTRESNFSFLRPFTSTNLQHVMVGNFHGNAISTITDIGRNLGLTWKMQTRV